MKKAIVTGATGFLGFVLTKELIQNGIYVYALCRKDSKRLSRLDGLEKVKIIEADFSKIEDVKGLSEADIFYHLAWEGERNSFEEQYKNVDISISCLRLAAKLSCKRFVCTGSQAEYGNTSELITEETPLKPTTAYGACKVAAYYLTADLAKRLGIEHTWVRVFSVFGPNDNPNTLIMTLIRSLTSEGETKLNTDGTHIWNYLYEDDAARALRLLGQSEGSNTVYNVASRDNKPLKEYVEIIRKSVNSNFVVYYGSEDCNINLNVNLEKVQCDLGDYENTRFDEAINILLHKC